MKRSILTLVVGWLLAGCSHTPSVDRGIAREQERVLNSVADQSRKSADAPLSVNERVVATESK
ncbi:MAG: hypothetical protein C0518_12675 [Opitutus sp.]|nr:hypothetical protein [Opitutus sp.]